ncbi:hypothetical protein U1Q18_037041 [Sarracenia purpurea var. burkii]
MSNGYNHHHLNQDQNLHQKTTFLPLLCSSRSSVKDVHLPRCRYRWTTTATTSSSSDPSSPKISCMGQVKRNNRVIGFPTPYRFTIAAAATATATTDSDFKYHKLKRLFSGKNLAAPAAACSRREKTVGGSARGGPRLSYKDNDDYAAAVNIGELDPPLPVVKRVRKPANGRDEVNLWRRRSGGNGIALKSLQIQQIHQPDHRCVQLQRISTVR